MGRIHYPSPQSLTFLSISGFRPCHSSSSPICSQPSCWESPRTSDTCVGRSRRNCFSQMLPELGAPPTSNLGWCNRALIHRLLSCGMVVMLLANGLGTKMSNRAAIITPCCCFLVCFSFMVWYAFASFLSHAFIAGQLPSASQAFYQINVFRLIMVKVCKSRRHFSFLKYLFISS